jgi:monovalent cation:H+ antiporter-2, CPA2 family
VPMGKILVAIHDKRADMRASLLEASSAAMPSQRVKAVRDSHANQRPDTVPAVKGSDA